MIKRDKNVIKSQMPKRHAIVVSIIWYILAMSLYFLFSSCKKIDENGFRDYVIKEGINKGKIADKGQ